MITSLPTTKLNIVTREQNGGYVSEVYIDEAPTTGSDKFHLTLSGAKKWARNHLAAISSTAANQKYAK